MTDELKRWRRYAHIAFDPLVRGKEKRTIRWAHEWLAEKMGLPPEQTRISMMDVSQCKQVIKICKEAKSHEKAQQLSEQTGQELQ